MSDYIEREAAIESFRKNLDGGYVLTNDAQTTHILQSLPAADVRPVARGKWNEAKRITDKYGWESIHWKCSSCGIEIETVSQIHDISAWHFCPNCGADMRAEGGE